MDRGKQAASEAVKRLGGGGRGAGVLCRGHRKQRELRRKATGKSGRGEGHVREQQSLRARAKD